MTRDANLPDMRPVIRRADACTRAAKVPWTTIEDLDPGDAFRWFGRSWLWTGAIAVSRTGYILELPITERVGKI